MTDDEALTEPLQALIDRNNARKPVLTEPKRQPHSELKKRCKAALLAWHNARGFPACGIPIQNLPVEIKDRRSGQTRKYQTGRMGAADLIWLCRGIAFAIELKMPWDTQRDSQKAFQAKWEASGGVYIIARDPAQLVKDVETEFTLRRCG